MPDIEAADAAGEIEVTVAVDILEPGVLRLGNVYRRAVRKPAGHGFRATLRECLRFGARYRCAKLNSGHRWFSAVVSYRQLQLARLATGHCSQYQPIGASFKLMWTCLVSRYSSIPQGPVRGRSRIV